MISMEKFFFCLGTKIDLREDRDFVNQLQKQNLQSIKREQGQRLCKKIRAFKYVECSALTQKGLKQVCRISLMIFFPFTIELISGF